MNKFTLFMIMVAWLFIATYFVNAFEIYSAGNFGVDGSLTLPNVGEGGFLAQASSMASTFFNLLSFNITGIPAIAVVLFFYIPTFGFVYILIDIVKDLIPFT